MAHIHSNERLEEKLLQFLAEPDDRDRAYVYRITDGNKVKPPIYNGPPFEGLQEYIRDNFVVRDEDGYGIFHIIIRRGEMMLLSGTISFELPLSQRLIQ